MKKFLLSLTVFVSIATMQSQNLVTENFTALGLPAVFPAGWVQTNQSVPVGIIGWFQGGGGATFAAFNGAATDYAGCNFNSTTGANTISNWLITPAIDVQNGDVVSFYTRQVAGNTFPDRMEFRQSTNGAFTTNPAGGNTNVGDFTTVLHDINPTLTAAGYPSAWTQFTSTMTGLTGVTSCKFAFRYFVTQGGPTGANSNYIGVDAFSVDRPLATSQFFAQNFIVFPNPATDVINVSAKSNAAVSGIEMTDLNGRVVKQANGSVSQINISELTSGVYFLKVSSELGSGTTKIVKQ